MEVSGLVVRYDAVGTWLPCRRLMCGAVVSVHSTSVSGAGRTTWGFDPCASQEAGKHPVTWPAAVGCMVRRRACPHEAFKPTAGYSQGLYLAFAWPVTEYDAMQ